MAFRLLIALVGFSLAVTSCSTAESQPSQFEGMASDKVGCTIVYGDTDPYIVGPLGPSDSKEVHPNDYTSFRIARTASDIIFVVEQPESGSNGSIPINNLPDDGIVTRGPFRNGGNLGYVITCWRGAS